MRLSQDVEKAILEIIGEQDRDIVSKAAADLLKSLLLLYGSAWESDLKDVLMGIWSIRNLDLDQIGELQDALSKAEELLCEKKIIEVETRPRGDLGRDKPIQEKFYTTRYLYLLMKLFSGDLEVDRFRYQTQGYVNL